MGAGCSSPLKRLGGRRGKSTRRNSSSAIEAHDEGGGDDNLKDQKVCKQQQTTIPHDQSLTPHEGSSENQQHKLVLDNENTIQSEINDDHPSTASYYTDGKYHMEELTKNSEHSASIEPKSSAGNATTSSEPNNCSLSGGSAVARMMGINGGSYVPHDRHLLVSPALSPAPSTCYSPSPANSTASTNYTMLDLNDLNEACKIITFGVPNNQQQLLLQQSQNQTMQRINYRHNLSETNNYYTQQLVQCQDDLTEFISVIFITSENFQLSKDNETNTSDGNSSHLNTEHLANTIESNLKTFCDEHQFNLRFLNLSYAHLSNHFHINNLLSAAMKIFEQEYLENSQRIIVIALSNVVNTSLNTSTDSTNNNSQQNNLDKRQLPTKIEAQLMNQLLLEAATTQDSSSGDHISSLLKSWYNQVGNVYCLNPIYLVYPKILAETNEERNEAWQNWLKESNQMIKFIDRTQESNKESNVLRLKSLYNSYIDYIVNEPALQKRTLLIRNYSQLVNNNIVSNQPQQQSTIQGQSKDSSLNDLVRLLADPNKLTLKRSIDEEEFCKTVNDWIVENFVESMLENQIVNGKHIPPFIERNLFIELTLQRHRLEYYLDSITESFESKCLNFYNSQISPILTGVLNSASKGAGFVESSTQQQSSNHLVFISGPKGCGKSSLFAQIIKLAAQDLYNKAQIIYRFCGISLDSMASNRLLRSICEQFCQTQGENITAASYIYSARKEVMNSLNQIIKQQTSIIFIDGMKMFYEKNNCFSDLDWLCEIESNPRVKFFITLETDSELYKKALGTYNEATYITLDHPTITEWAQMLTSTARSKRFNSATSLYDEIKNLNLNSNQKSDSNEKTKLNYKDFSDIIHMCRIRKLNNELLYPELSVKMVQNNPIENLKNIHQVILSHLHYLVPPYQLCALFVIINSSRNGLTEVDIINIMTMISQLKTASNNNSTKFSRSLLNYIKIQLQPWLVYIICDKTVKITFERGFLNSSIDYYSTNIFKNVVEEIREILIEYYSRQTKSKSSGVNITSSKSDLAEQRVKIGSAELLWLGTQASELLNLLISTNPSKAREHILNKQQFYTQFLYNQMPEEFIEDYLVLKDIQGKKGSSGSEELQCLVNYIKQSVYPLRYDGTQIYSQIYCRAIETLKSGKGSKSKKLNDILSIASCPPTKNLLPVSDTSVNSFIKTRIGLNQPPQLPITTSTSSSLIAPSQAANNSASQKSGPSSQSSGQSKQRIYTIKDNHRHVIVIYPDRGSLSVWDIFEEKPVRTINNLDQPRDLRMIDQKRAVILCNRELRVYDLDSGALLNKLKGVMNQKMPFFEVYSENYVVALARNRMYVNMLNSNTGELETTFKVGEDRFLNSLLVSANGGICVCGDETQKPFPLLVWNLNERRLMYDLRLDRHEFLTRMSAISDDGHFVVSVCKQLGDSDSNNPSGGSQGKSSPNFIVIYDLNSGTLFKKWKPGVDSCAVAISLSANRSGKVVNCIVNNTILIWDLATGSKKHTLMGHSAPVDVIRVQNNRLFSMDSTCRDQSLRIWDIEEGHCMAVFSPDAPINCCQMSIRGDALVCGFAAETRLSTLVMCKNETVNDVVKRNKRRKSSKSLYIFDEPPARKSSS